MQKITTHLWFNDQAHEAAALYASLFDDAKVGGTIVIDGTPSGQVDIISVTMPGQEFMLLNGGPMFAMTPAISMMVSVPTVADVDAIWAKLLPGGTPMMELGAYPWSARYGWIRDAYGLTWQIMQADDAADRQTIVPAMMFTGNVAGKAEEAMRYYASVFDDASVHDAIVARYGADAAPNAEGTIMYGPFTLLGQSFVAMDNAYEHGFGFNEGISLIVYCDTPEQLDHYWDALSAVPEAEACGWCKDRFGVSWQIVPADMDEMMATTDKARLDRIVAAILPMQKLDVAALRRAAAGE